VVLVRTSGPPPTTTTTTTVPTFTTTTLPIPAGLDVRTLALATGDLAYDQVRQRLYASVPGTNPVYGNSIVALDPDSGAITGSVFGGSRPGQIVIDHDATTLYVILEGALAVRRVDLASFTAGIRFHDPMGPGPIADVAIRPGHPDTVAVSRPFAYGDVRLFVD